MKDIKILITGVGSITAESIIKSYKVVKERNITIVGVDIKDFVPNELIDKYYKGLKPTEENYIERLLNICKEENIDYLIPLVDQELELLAENKQLFSKYNTTICLNDKDKISLIQDKYKLYKYLEKNKISVPKCIKFNNIDEFINGCKVLNYPTNIVCYKPLKSSGSRGFRIIKDDIDYEEYLFNEKPTSKYINYDFLIEGMKKCKVIPEMMLMEYVAGDLYNVNVLADNGKIIYLVAGKVIRFEIGNTVECEIANNKEIYDYCKKIVKLLNLSGNIGFEVAYDSNKELKLIEINPRVQGQITSSTAAGVNFPYYELKMLSQEPLPIIDNITPIKMVRYFKDSFCVEGKILKIDGE